MKHLTYFCGVFNIKLILNHYIEPVYSSDSHMCGCDNKMISNSLKKSGGGLYAVVKSTDSGTRLPGCESWLEDFTPSHQDLEHIKY